MADNQKYYYMRLKEGFFSSDEIVLLEAMPEGYLYSNILLKLYLKSLRDNGKLMLNERIPYNANMIAAITGHQIGTVEKALQLFRDMGLIEILDSGAIYMLDIQKYIGKTSTEADRKKAYRMKIEADRLAFGQMSAKCPDKVGQMSDEIPPEIEIKKEIEIESEIEIDSRASDEAKITAKKTKKGKNVEKHKYGEWKNVLLSDEELEKLKDRFPDWEERIERLSLYIESKGAKYKSHYATILSWARREDTSGKKMQGTGKYEPQKGNRTADMLQESYVMLGEWAQGE